jgi:hypothetical protein
MSSPNMLIAVGQRVRAIIFNPVSGVDSIMRKAEFASLETFFLLLQLLLVGRGSRSLYVGLDHMMTEKSSRHSHTAPSLSKNVQTWQELAILSVVMQ